MLLCVCMTFIGFVSGSVMYSYIIPNLLYKTDIRENSDDGNPGSGNAMASAGLPVGLACMFCDAAKGFAPVFISVSILHISGYYMIPIAAAPVFGHAFSPFLKFKGGKAVAASLGAMLGTVAISGAVFVFVLTLLIFSFVIIINPDSSKVITAYAAGSAVLFVTEPLLAIKIAALVVSAVVCFKHYKNPNREELSIRLFRFAIYDNKSFRFKKG